MGYSNGECEKHHFHYLCPHVPEIGSLMVEVDEEEDYGGIHEDGGDGEVQHRQVGRGPHAAEPPPQHADQHVKGDLDSVK